MAEMRAGPSLLDEKLIRVALDEHAIGHDEMEVDVEIDQTMIYPHRRKRTRASRRSTCSRPRVRISDPDARVVSRGFESPGSHF